ncbi:MAG: PEGA domain-containing protein [Polyangia bacterium]|jgi:tetratricopeptide (TPR) repeat protein
MNRWLSALLAVGILASASTGWAAGGDEDEVKGAATGAAAQDARKKFAEGNERYARGDYPGAIESFKAAIAEDPTLPGPYRNLGLAYRAVDRCADALPNYEKYMSLRPESRFTDRVRREIDLCRAKLGMQAPSETAHPQSGGTFHPPTAQSYLHVAANLIGGEATDEASVRIDGLVRGSTPLTIPVTAGHHRIHLEHPGFETADATVDVPAGERSEVELTMNKLAIAPLPVAAAAGANNGQPAGPKVSYRKYAWALLGVAGGLGAMGAGFGIAESALHRDAVSANHATTTRDAVNKLASDGSNYAIGAYVGLSLGAAALAASVIVFMVDPSRGETHAKQKYVLGPTVSTGGAGFAAAGSW